MHGARIRATEFQTTAMPLSASRPGGAARTGEGFSRAWAKALGFNPQSTAGKALSTHTKDTVPIEDTAHGQAARQAAASKALESKMPENNVPEKESDLSGKQVASKAEESHAAEEETEPAAPEKTQPVFALHREAKMAQPPAAAHTRAASEGLEATTEAASVEGKKHKLQAGESELKDKAHAQTLAQTLVQTSAKTQTELQAGLVPAPAVLQQPPPSGTIPSTSATPTSQPATTGVAGSAVTVTSAPARRQLAAAAGQDPVAGDVAAGAAAPHAKSGETDAVAGVKPAQAKARRLGDDAGSTASGAGAGTVQPVAHATVHTADAGPTVGTKPAADGLHAAQSGMNANTLVNTGGLASVAVHTSQSHIGADLHHAVLKTMDIAGPDVTQQHHVLSAGPGQLEVGVMDGTHGWLKIRAELAAGGGISASLTASAAAHDPLRQSVPELASYLASEAVSVNTIAVHRAAEGAPAGAMGMTFARDGGAQGGAPQGDRSGGGASYPGPGDSSRASRGLGRSMQGPATWMPGIAPAVLGGGRSLGLRADGGSWLSVMA